MSSKPRKTSRESSAEPLHDTVSFEQRDIKATTIYWYLIALAVAVVLSYIVCVFVLRMTTKIAVQSDTPPPPIREEIGKDYREIPPEPRLQGIPGHGSDPQFDLRQKIRQDTEANEKSGWIDQDSGIVQIPVKDAMRIIAEKGLSRPSPSAAEKKK
jgi:hypothetical protein